jgi:hypothetical protein
LVTTTDDLDLSLATVQCPATVAGQQCTLQKAIVVADNLLGGGAKIVLPPGTYAIGDAGLSNTLSIESQSGDPRNTTIKAAKGLWVGGDGPASVGVSGVTITGLVSDFIPVVAVVGNATFTIRNAIVSGNSSSNSMGAALGAGGGNLVIDRVTVTDNHATGQSSNGAGVVVFNRSTAVISNSTIAGNTATGMGGGIAIDSTSSLNVMNTTVAGNEAKSGGGVAQIRLGVSALAAGSASGTTSWTRPTDAHAAANGSRVPGDTARPAPVKIGPSSVTNTIVSGNKPSNCVDSGAGLPPSKGNNLEDDAAKVCGFDKVGDPKLGVLKNNGGFTPTLALAPDSPAIDAGSNAVCAAAPVNGTDQRGLPRTGKNNPACDIGAFEAQPVVAPGYWTAAAEGGVFSFGSARDHFHGSLANVPLNGPVVGIAARPDGDGYWMTASDGAVFAFGTAGKHYYGSLSGRRLNAPIVGIAPAPDGAGYWLVASDGGVFAFGSARFLGSLGGVQLQGRIVSISVMPDGQGYWLAGADGGIFAFGTARYLGSMGGRPLTAKIVGISTMPDGQGYWLAGADGGIFAFGSAVTRYFGSMGGAKLQAPIAGIGALKDGKGYWLVAADGGVFSFGAAMPNFSGSMGGVKLNGPMTAIAVSQ